jgi:Lon-like ATP-dependent protease
MKRGQPYLGAFLLKDENTDADVITDINQVHQVGVFAQITSVFTAASPRDADGVPGEKHEEGLTAVLYPHRRIKITELVQSGAPSTMAEVQTEPQSTTPDPAAQLPTPPTSPPPEGRKQAAEQVTSGESDENQ